MPRSVFLENVRHAFLQTDGTMMWPNSLEGDLLRQAHHEIERTQAMRDLKEPGDSWTFNINDTVKIRLTDSGREIYRDFRARMRSPAEIRDRPEDSEGWSSWQLWQVMSTFGGDHVSLGCLPPFMEMKIEED